MKITRKSLLTGVVRTLEINISEQQLEQWKLGKHIQWVCPQLAPEDREFLISGTTAEEWDETFPEVEE